MWKKILQKEICLIYLQNITLILDGRVLKINLRAKNVENHAFLRGSRVLKIMCFAASFSASSQVTRETKHFFQLCMTWSLPREKLDMLLIMLGKCFREEAQLTLHQVEVLHGKLVHISQHILPISLLLDEVICFLRESLLKLEKVSERDSIKTDVPESLKHDLHTAFCILRYSRENPLPILDYCGMPVLTATRVWTDASGHIKASPSIGIFVPESSKSHLWWPPWPFQDSSFMQWMTKGREHTARLLPWSALDLLLVCAWTP